MVELVLVLLLATGILALAVRRLLVSVICMAVFSLLSSLLFFLLKAPDVAIAEAAVGAGVSTLIFVWAISKTAKGRRDESTAGD